MRLTRRRIRHFRRWVIAPALGEALYRSAQMFGAPLPDWAVMAWRVPRLRPVKFHEDRYLGWPDYQPLVAEHVGGMNGKEDSWHYSGTRSA